MSKEEPKPPMQFQTPDGVDLEFRHTNNWFNQYHRETWDRLFFEEGVAGSPPEVGSYLEIGVCEGSSMLWVLDRLKPFRVVGIDPWKPRLHRRREREKFERQAEETHANAMHNLKYWLGGTVQLIREPSIQALKSREYDERILKPESFDLIYVDGDHEALPALTDMVLAWPKLKVGGIMILDDYNRRWLHGKPKSYEAINAFLMACDSRYHFIYRGNRQQIIRKIK